MASASQYKLRYLPLFWSDLNEAATYIADVLENPAAAERLVDAAEIAVLGCLKAPTMGRVYRSAHARERTYYWTPVGNYMLFYVVIGDVMEVRRFVYGARDLTRMLP